jgi:hypothetical protein
MNLYENYDRKMKIYGGKILYEFDELTPSEQFEARKGYYAYLPENNPDKERFYSGLVQQQTKLEHDWREQMAKEGFENLPEDLFEFDKNGEITLQDEGFLNYFGLPRQQSYGDVNVSVYLVNHEPLDFAKDTNPFHIGFNGLNRLPEDVDPGEFRRKMEQLMFPKEKEEKAKKLINSLADLQKRMHRVTWEWKLDDSELKKNFYDSADEVRAVKKVVPVGEAPKKHLIYEPENWEISNSEVEYQ